MIPPRTVLLSAFVLLSTVALATASGDCGGTCHYSALCINATQNGPDYCQCQVGYRDISDLVNDGPGTNCIETGFAIRYIIETKIQDNPEFMLDSEVLGVYCPASAEGWWIEVVDGDLTGFSVDGYSAVWCIFADAAAATAGITALDRLNVTDISVDADVKRWVLPTTANPLPIAPTGMEVLGAAFDPSCAATGCWVITGVLTTGASLKNNNAFNSFYLPHSVGSDALSYDFDYTLAGNGAGLLTQATGDAVDAANLVPVEWTYAPANHPCTSASFDASNGNTQEVTTCCITNPAIGEATGTDGSKGGFLANYRPTDTFKSWADSTLASCYGPDGEIVTRPGYMTPDNTSGFDYVDFPSDPITFLNSTFKGMTDSPGVSRLDLTDPFYGQYTFEIRLDEVELRINAGKLVGTVGVEHTIDTFLGFTNFRATGIEALDTFSTQTALHLEKTSFFSVSTHGTNDYTFLEYVNLRLVTIYKQDTDFSDRAGEETTGFFDTNSSGSADYIQVTFTLGEKYGVNTNAALNSDDELIPTTSVRTGKGTFFGDVDSGMAHSCVDYDDNSFTNKATFDSRITDQDCSPKSTMCLSPSSIPDHFVSFNIPLGMDYYPTPSPTLSENIFVDFVINAIVLPSFRGSTPPNEGGDPYQMKTTLTASIPVVAGGINIFCDGLVSKTDLKDVANADIVVGSAASMEELSRLRIKKDIASTVLADEASTRIDSDSIESGLMTLVLKGNHSYFGLGVNSGRADVSLELEDLITIHIMESGTGDGANGEGDSESKVEKVAALLAMAADDNSFSDGIDTDGYNLNGAFSFTIERESQRAHLEPTPALLGMCPFNPTRPTGNAEIETCITRRDVRYRQYPARTGSFSTAMEICANVNTATLQGDQCNIGGSFSFGSACCGGTGAVPYETEINFLKTILGDSDYTETLAPQYTNVIAEQYTLNQRYLRAYWINPGYEWTPTQTGGNSIFSLSQFLYLFALITLDEGVSTIAGNEITGDAITLPDLTSRRRMLLQAEDGLKDAQSSLGGDKFAFDVTPSSMMASAFGVKVDRVASFNVKLALTEEEACMDMPTLQNSIRETLDDYVQTNISPYHTLQVTSLTVDKGDVQCRRRSSVRKLLTGFSSAEADTTVVVVFKEGGESQINLAAIASAPGVSAIEALTVSPLIDTAPPVDQPIKTPAPSGSSSSSSSSNIGLIAGVCGGVAGLLVAVLAFVLYKRSSKKEQEPIAAVQTINVEDLKTQLSADV